MRRLWRRLFGPRPRALPPRPLVANDWCCICFDDLFPGEVWERREHFTNTAEMGPEGGTWAARTYCERHAPADAIRV